MSATQLPPALAARLAQRGILQDAERKQRAEALKFNPHEDSLPQGWFPVIEVETGDVYFWNTMSDETQWEIPTEPATAPPDTPYPPPSARERLQRLSGHQRRDRDNNGSSGGGGGGGGGGARKRFYTQGGDDPDFPTQEPIEEDVAERLMALKGEKRNRDANPMEDLPADVMSDPAVAKYVNMAMRLPSGGRPHGQPRQPAAQQPPAGFEGAPAAAAAAAADAGAAGAGKSKHERCWKCGSKKPMADGTCMSCAQKLGRLPTAGPPAGAGPGPWGWPAPQAGGMPPPPMPPPQMYQQYYPPPPAAGQGYPSYSGYPAPPAGGYYPDDQPAYDQSGQAYRQGPPPQQQQSRAHQHQQHQHQRRPRGQQVEMGDDPMDPSAYSDTPKGSWSRGLDRESSL